MKKLLCILLFIKCYYNMAQNLEIISSKEGEKLIAQNSSFIEKHKSNNPIYRVKNGYYLLFSNESKYGVISKGEDGLDLIRCTTKFPIEIETNDIREAEQNKIRNIDQNISFYIDSLCENFDIDLNVNNENSLSVLSRKIDKNNLSKEDIFLISLFLNEMFRIRTNTLWALKPVETINTYWIPYITNSSKDEFNTFRSISKAVEENEGDINLVFIYRMELARFYGLRVFSKEHVEFIKTGVR